jgi:hypothetical protein
MGWDLVPALAAASVMVLFGIGAALKPESLVMVGVSADSPLGTSEIRVVFGGMFVALGVACIVTRDPLVFATVGAAWFADAAVRLVSTVIDRVPLRQATAVLATALAMGSALLSGYWLA